MDREFLSFRAMLKHFTNLLYDEDFDPDTLAMSDEMRPMFLMFAQQCLQREINNLGLAANCEESTEDPPDFSFDD
jgi:hypothetical protein